MTIAFLAAFAAFGVGILMDQRTMLYLGLGLLLVLVGLRQMRNPQTKKIGMLNAGLGLLLVAYALWTQFG